ncbi:hypothetical protein KIL84_003703, partial [Mauremys mutica]
AGELESFPSQSEPYNRDYPSQKNFLLLFGSDQLYTGGGFFSVAGNMIPEYCL